MKKILFLITIAFTLTFMGCGFLIPRTVTIDNVKYKNGFYGDLIPNSLSHDSEVKKASDKEFYHVNCDKWNLMLSYIGEYEDGTAYCDESQWDEAMEYYQDGANFDYYAVIGKGYAWTKSSATLIPDVDYSKFDELMEFAKENEYNPFTPISNDDVKTVRLAFPDEKESPEITLFKESKDGLFTSYQGFVFYIIDGKLYELFQIDCHNGEYEELIAVEVPNDLSDYFAEFLSEYTADIT